MEKKTDLRVLKTQKALCDTFLQMLSEMRFEDITVNELCERAMVRRATFYKHFADKYDFFGFFVREIQESFMLEIKQRSKDNDLSSYYVQLFKECIKFFNRHDKMLDSVVKSNVFPALFEIFSDEIYIGVLERLKEQQALESTSLMSIEILASIYTGGIVQVLRYWVTRKKAISEEALVAEIDKITSFFGQAQFGKGFL